MDNQKPNLYTIKGGIGKCVAFTALIEQLAKKDGKKIVVGAGYPGVFNAHPNVAGTLKGITEQAITPVADQFDNIVWREPYVSNYCKGNSHILDEWAKLYGMKPLKGGGYNSRPDLVVPEGFQKQSEELKSRIEKPFFIVQWTGGQPPNNFNNKKKYPDNYLTKGRNVRNYQEIMLALAEEYPDHQFLIFALPNEPIEVPASLKSRVLRAKAGVLAFADLLRSADSFIALDSCLQHFGAARQIDKKGVVLWGQTTRPERIGYSCHTNLNSSDDDQVIVPVPDVLDSLKAILNDK
ncbi:MAG: hypothetical protein ACRBB6_01300 [Neptuniibacter sp.]